MANAQKIRIRLKAYDHELIDQSAEKIIETAKRNGAKVSGPIPLPTEKQIVTILRAVHKYKDSREQFERRTHKRLIDIINPNQATIEALTTLDLRPALSSRLSSNLKERTRTQSPQGRLHKTSLQIAGLTRRRFESPAATRAARSCWRLNAVNQ